MTKRKIQNKFVIHIECLCGNILKVSTNPVTRIVRLKQAGWKEEILSTTRSVWHCDLCERRTRKTYIQTHVEV